MLKTGESFSRWQLSNFVTYTYFQSKGCHGTCPIIFLASVIRNQNLSGRKWSSWMFIGLPTQWRWPQVTQFKFINTCDLMLLLVRWLHPIQMVMTLRPMPTFTLLTSMFRPLPPTQHSPLELLGSLERANPNIIEHLSALGSNRIYN